MCVLVLYLIFQVDLPKMVIVYNKCNKLISMLFSSILLDEEGHIKLTGAIKIVSADNNSAIILLLVLIGGVFFSSFIQILDCVRKLSIMRRRRTRFAGRWSTWLQKWSTGKDTLTALTGGHLEYWWCVQNCAEMMAGLMLLTFTLIYLAFFFSLEQFEMLTGSLPFQGKDRKETMNLILKWESAEFLYVYREEVWWCYDWAYYFVSVCEH